MNKVIKSFFKRGYFKFLIYLNKLITAKENISDSEKLCMGICRRLINHPKSSFLIAPLSGKKYIRNEYLKLFVVLDNKKITITNHVYHYDIILNDKNWTRINTQYDIKTEKLRQVFENDMMSQNNHSLSIILKKII